MRKATRLFTVFTTMCLMLLLTVNASFAEDKATSKPIQKAITLGKVTLKENVTAEVNDLMAVPSGTGQTIGFTLHVTNNSNTDLDFVDYWVNLFTKSGVKLTVQTSETKIIVQGKSSKDILYYAKASSNVKLADLIVKVIKWDFSSPSYTKVLGQISVPQRYNPVTPMDNGRAISVGDTKASFVIEQATIGKSDKYYRPDIDLIIKNEGSSSVALPDYQLYIQTNENLLYPISVTNLKGATLDPLTEKKFDLTASIPIAVKEGTWKLVVTVPVNEGKDKVPVAQMELPKANTTVGSDLNKYYTFTNANGVYYIKLNSINRLPIEDNDLVVANLTITNKGTETLPAPDLVGKYLFNGNIEKSVNVSNNKKVIAISPGASIDIQASGIVPYTFDIAKVQLQIQQKDATSSEVTDLVAFTYSGAFSSVATVTAEQGFEIKDVGYRSSVKVKDFRIYNGTSANIIAAQLKLTNQEKRLADMQQLAGYYEKSDGTVYPATFQSTTDKLNPGGNALIYAWASVPKDADVSDIKLVVGKAIVETTQADSSKTTVTGYVSPYSFVLPTDAKEQAGLQKIDVTPYQLSINRVLTQINFQESQVKLEFAYTMEQDLLTKADMKDQSLVIELKDANGKAAFSKQFTIGTTDSDSSNSTAASLKIGTNTASVTWTDEDFVLFLTTLKDFEFNVYHEIQPGYKKLIATEKLPWLVNRTLD